METIKNLAAAFIGESQARNRYTMYAKIAKKEGYEQIAANFEETAEQEREHASWLMKMIQDLKYETDEKVEEIKVEEAPVPVTYGITAENLKAAIDGENFENTDMYPSYANKAAEEGYESIAARLRSIASAEGHHEERYRKFLENLENDALFKKDEEVTWVCRKCGYQHVGKEAPAECPSCSHPRAYYQVKCEQY